jgi:hypothetical protein
MLAVLQHLTSNYIATSIKPAWYWHKNSYEDPYNRIEDPGINPHNCSYLIFDKGSQNILWRKNSPPKIVLGKLDICM